MAWPMKRMIRSIQRAQKIQQENCLGLPSLILRSTPPVRTIDPIEMLRPYLLHIISLNSVGHVPVRLGKLLSHMDMYRFCNASTSSTKHARSATLQVKKQMEERSPSLCAFHIVHVQTSRASF